AVAAAARAGRAQRAGHGRRGARGRGSRSSSCARAFVESVVAARVLARHDGGAAVLDDVVSRGQVVTIALQTVPAGEAQLVPAAPVADVVVGLDGDDLIAVAGREPPRALVNLGRVPLG